MSFTPPPVSTLSTIEVGVTENPPSPRSRPGRAGGASHPERFCSHETLPAAGNRWPRSRALRPNPDIEERGLACVAWVGRNSLRETCESNSKRQ